jgi:hypothetical protein
MSVPKQIKYNQSKPRRILIVKERIMCLHTCIFPMRNENKTKPAMEMKTAKLISQKSVLVARFWPRELQ